MTGRNRSTPGRLPAPAREPGPENRTGYEIAGELRAEAPRSGVPVSAARDPQQTHAAGPDLWGAPD
ncbi:MAG: hypothetical protein ACOY93_13200 [Bacillota bacterium]